MRKVVGCRVGALQRSDETHVYAYGFGVYVGDEVPTTAAGWMGEVLREQRIPNPKLVLDDGSVVWGCECWWGPEEKVRAAIGDREVVPVSIEAERAALRGEEVSDA